MPGNIGYVLLGKLASLFVPDPVTAFLAVNVGLTVLGVVFCYLFATLIVPRSLAAALAFAMSCNPIVWFHGGIIASYPVWLAVLPAIGWFGVRYKREGQFGDLIGTSVALGDRDDSSARLALLWSSALVRLSCAGPGPLAALAHRRVDRGAWPAPAGSSGQPGSWAGWMSISNGSRRNTNSTGPAFPCSRGGWSRA